MFDNSWISLSISNFIGTPAVFSFDLEEGIYGDDLLIVNILTHVNVSNSIVGADASFSFEFGGKKEFFNGIVTGYQLKQSANGTSVATLKIKTLCHLLDKETKQSVYCDSNIEEIARSILGKAGISSVKYILKSYHGADFRIQYNESDLSFLQRLFECNGITEFVRHFETRSELVIFDGDNFEASEFAFTESTLEVTDKGNIFYGLSHSPVRLGVSFELFGETFAVFSVSHSGCQAAAFGIKDNDEGYFCQITAFSKNKLGSLPRIKPKPHVPGVIVAQTAGFDNSPAALDSQGRYIVRMPFDEASPEMASSIPVHLSQRYSCEGGGVHFPLRKGTPVLISFEDGDIDRPVALGAMPKGAHKGPIGDGNTHENVIKTTSGIEAVFDDNSKSFSLDVPSCISANSGNDVVIESGGEITLKSGNIKIGLGSDGALNIESSGDIFIDANARVSLSGSSVDMGTQSSQGAGGGASASGAVGIGNSFQGDGSSNLAVQSIAVNLPTQASGAGNAQGTAAATGTNTQSTLFVKKVEGAAETYPRQKIVYKAKLSKTTSKMSADDKSKKITWSVKAGNANEKSLSEDTEKITLDIDKDWEGKEILVMACIDNTVKESFRTKVLKDSSTLTLIRGVVGEDKAYIGLEIKYEVTNSNKDGSAGNVNGNSDIKWAIKVGKDGSIDKNMLKDKKGERILALTMKDEWAGKEIVVMPYLNSPTETVSVRTKVKRLVFPIVIDRYKMPGLNNDGTDIADDMCYGIGYKLPRPIYQKPIIEKYKKEYQEDGFYRPKHKNFCNEDYSLKPIYDKEYILEFVNARQEKQIPIFGFDDSLYKLFLKLLDEPADKETLERDFDKLLFEKFRNMADIFTLTDGLYYNIFNNISIMIELFQHNEGGIYENEALTDKIKTHPSTERYCRQLEKYIKKKLKENNGNILKLEDNEVDWKKNNSPHDTKDERKEKKGKDFDLTPVYPPISTDDLSNLKEKFENIFEKFENISEKLGNTFGGATIELNDIWATEVVINEYKHKPNDSKYEVKYQVTLWDHFGLDTDDLGIDKYPAKFGGFISWFLLQHFRGYRPFITKITFEKDFSGDLKDEIN